MKTALIVIDVQKYFLNKSTNRLPERIYDYIKNNKFDLVLFTKFVNNAKSNFSKSLSWHECTGSPDTDIAEELLEFTKNGNIFEKHTFSGFKNKKLVKFLRDKKIDSVYLCGTDSDACVLASAFDAFDLGFHVTVLKDLCASCNGNNFHGYGKAIIERNLEKGAR